MLVTCISKVDYLCVFNPAISIKPFLVILHFFTQLNTFSWGKITQFLNKNSNFTQLIAIWRSEIPNCMKNYLLLWSFHLDPWSFYFRAFKVPYTQQVWLRLQLKYKMLDTAHFFDILNHWISNNFYWKDFLQFQGKKKMTENKAHCINVYLSCVMRKPTFCICENRRRSA